MNTFTNNKLTKKFILILVVLILFGFCYPKNVNAALGFDDLEALPLSIFYTLLKGAYGFLNNIFTEPYFGTKEVLVSSKYEAKSLIVYLTPENIIKGKFILFDANIFQDVSSAESTNKYKYYDDASGGVIEGKVTLRNTIAGWYYALRNFAVVALLSVLVYVGIRMITSTISQDKAKYKVMFKDWLVALCLVVVMHYIMIGILEVTSLITESIGNNRR